MKSPLWLALVLVLVMAAIPPLVLDARNAFLAAPTAQSNVPVAKTDTPAATATPSRTTTATPSRTPTAGATRTSTVISTASSTPTIAASVTPTTAASATPTAVPVGPITPGNFNSTVLIANLDSVQASARLRVFSRSGAEVYNTTRTIAANGVLSVALPTSLGDGFVGSATVSSSQKVYALVLNANPSNGAREIYETSKTPQTSLSFAVFRHLGSDAQKSVIAVRNTNPASAAAVTFHYYAPNGAEAAGSPLPVVTIPANGSYTYDSQMLFGAAVVSYTVRMDSDISIAAAERVEFVKDTAGLFAMTAGDLGTEAYLGWIERGVSGSSRPDSWSEIYIRNGGSAATNVTVTYYNSNGSVQDSQSSNVAPNGFALFDTRAASALGSAFLGYARVTQSGSQPLGVQWLEAGNQGQVCPASMGCPPAAMPPNGPARMRAAWISSPPVHQHSNRERRYVARHSNH